MDSSSHNKSQKVLFNGVYVFTDNKQVVKISDRYWVVRFYPNNSVIACAIEEKSSKEELVKQISPWFKKDSQNLHIGTYEIDNNNIEFTVTWVIDSIKFMGRIENSKTLVLQLGTQDGGTYTNYETYSFVSFNSEIKEKVVAPEIKEEQPTSKSTGGCASLVLTIMILLIFQLL